MGDNVCQLYILLAYNHTRLLTGTQQQQPRNSLHHLQVQSNLVYNRAWSATSALSFHLLFLSLSLCLSVCLVCLSPFSPLSLSFSSLSFFRLFVLISYMMDSFFLFSFFLFCLSLTSPFLSHYSFPGPLLFNSNIHCLYIRSVTQVDYSGGQLPFYCNYTIVL